jgi:bacteriocin-like protein
MENENKEKKVILTDEELKEVTGGAGGLPPGAQPVCKGLSPYNCAMRKQVCTWDKAKNECVSTQSWIVS